jgi:DNA-binding LytR/AlgR family response regulator
VNSKIYQVQNFLKSYFGVFLSIGFGVFLFILFYQPFPLDDFDFNNRLIFIAGFAAIVFLIMIIIRIPFLLFFQNNNPTTTLPDFIRGFLIFVLSSAAFAFYLYFVGNVPISFYIMLKVSLICLAVPIILWLYDFVKHLKISNILLSEERKSLQKQITEYQDNYLNQPVVFTSDNGADTIKLMNSDVAFIRSADNYVEVVYLETDEFKRKLIRNTMKGIEQQIKAYSNFIRCHRICIVNIHFIEKLNKSNDSYHISIRGYEEKLPVSRQYLLRLKEIT